MANLVAPVNFLPPAEERIIEFKGLNRRTTVNEGEMSDMLNLCSDNYPTLSPRKPRGVVEMPEGSMRPLQMATHNGKLAMIAIVNAQDEVGFFYDGVRYGDSETLPLTTSSRMIAINTKICFFPQKTYITCRRSEGGVITGETIGSLEASVNLINNSFEINDTSIRINLPQPGGDYGFKYDDAIHIAGTMTVTSGGAITAKDVDVYCAIENADSGEGYAFIDIPQNTFIELTGATAMTFTGTISRTMKDLEHLIVWNNRLWGVDSTENVIYASKLGDPTNWEYYQGTGIDSYYAQQGTDESFTGVAEYSGHLIYFKPSSMTRIYGTSPQNYQLTTAKCYGIEEGSALSALTINDTVYYKSAIGIMAYQGGVPYCISDKFNFRFSNVVAATEGTKYYASCIVDKGQYVEGQLMVYDTLGGFWHKEDNRRITSACKIENRIYCTSATGTIIYCGESDSEPFCSGQLLCCSEAAEGKGIIINPNTILNTHEEAIAIDPDDPPENYEDLEWMAQFGPFDEYIEEHKIYSKLAMRLKANGKSSAKVYISLDEGPWEQVENYPEISTKGDFIPIVPRRCDRYSVKIAGKGNCEVKSLTRRVRRGSFGRL